MIRIMYKNKIIAKSISPQLIQLCEGIPLYQCPVGLFKSSHIVSVDDVYKWFSYKVVPNYRNDLKLLLKKSDLGNYDYKALVYLSRGFTVGSDDFWLDFGLDEAIDRSIKEYFSKGR